jgi:hypothetical protein
MQTRQLISMYAVALLGFAAASLLAPPAHAQTAPVLSDATKLSARYVNLRGELANNRFKKPLHLNASESDGILKGDVYAEVAQPYALIAQNLQSANRWCDILILHLNVKFCTADSAKTGSVLSMRVGRKFDQPLDDAHAFEFLFKVAAVRPDYMRVTMDADQGPLGTSDYRVILEMVKLDSARSFLHLTYSYRYGVRANVAMRTYLATAGRDKLGFSVAGRKANGEPNYAGGMRGIAERNTMRYYLAIESYLGASGASPEQLEKRLNDWHTAVEQYPQQLHEMEREAYLAMKRKEVARQQATRVSRPTALTAAR